MHTELPTSLSKSATTALKTKGARFASTTPDRKVFGATSENPSLGPGSYEIKSTLRFNEGFSFQVHGNEDDRDKDPITGFRHSYLDNPGPGYYPQYTTLESKGYSFPSALSKREGRNESPGPGRYYLSARASGVGHFFSPIPRFELSPIERLASSGYTAYTPRLHNVSKKEKELIRRRIEENKDVSRFCPQERAKSLQRLASTHARKFDITRSIKQLLDEERHHARLMRLDEKISKMELRLNSHEVRLVKKTWVYCVVMASASTQMHLKLRHFQTHLMAVRRYLRLWASITIFVVCFLYQIRKRRYRKHLRVYFVALGRQWLQLYIRPMRERVTEVVETYLMQAMLKKLLERWVTSKSFLESHLLCYVKRRKALIDRTMQKLKKIELDALNPTSQKSKIFPDIPVAKLAFESVSNSMRQKEISRQISLRLQAYLSILKLQQQAVKSFQQFVALAVNNKKYIDGYEVNWTEVMPVPTKPKLILEFSRKDLEQIALEIAGKNQTLNLFPKFRRNTKQLPHFPTSRSRASSKHHR